jgi:hypothetical protein
LQKRYDAEKEALLARLRGENNCSFEANTVNPFLMFAFNNYFHCSDLLGVESAYMTESERQAALARMRREKRRAEREEGFEKAALLIGLAEKQQIAAMDK